MGWFKWPRKRRMFSIEVEAATLMFRCESRLVQADFSDLEDSTFAELSSLTRLTKSGFIFLFLEGAAKDRRYKERANQLLIACEIVFDPDFAKRTNIEETKKVGSFIARVGSDAFHLIDLVGIGSPQDPVYFQRLGEWSRGWLSKLGEPTASAVANRYGLPLAALTIAEIAELRQLLKESLGVPSDAA